MTTQENDNAVMFFIIVASALYGKSNALLADSLDNLGDALTYGLAANSLCLFLSWRHRHEDVNMSKEMSVKRSKWNRGGW